jgi:membrane-associated phospholipid phosphatase
MKREGYFWVLTAVLILLIVLQAGGMFSGINESIDSLLPRGWAGVGALTETAGLLMSLLYILLFLLWDFKKGGRMNRFTLELSMGFVLSMLIVAVLKISFATSRPGETPVSWGLLERVKNLDYFAFPSGHTARASIFAYFLSRRWKKLWPIWWGWAVAIALSRLLLHVHWFGDVLFSQLLGPWVGMAVELTEDRWLPYYRRTIRRLKLGVFDVE